MWENQDADRSSPRRGTPAYERIMPSDIGQNLLIVRQLNGAVEGHPRAEVSS